MAYDASNINENDQQVAGSAPLSQGGGTSPAAQGQDQGAPQGPSAPATIQAGQSSTQAAQSQQPKQSNKPASSGMFTNIQNYVQKNQPAAQKMAGAVSQNVGNQASEIRQVAEQKKQQQASALQANQAAMDKQKQEAAGIIHQQTGVAVGGYQPPTQTQEQSQSPNIEEQAARFQQLSQGPQGVTQVGDLNLAQQNLKSQALQQLAQGANTEQGRQNLLKQTFQGQAPAGYTRGLSGLDQLVVSGDQAAREQMITGTQQQANQLQADIQNIGSEANKAKMANDLAISKFGSDISALSEEAQNAILAEVDANVTSQQQEWTSQIDQLRNEANKQFQEGLKYSNADAFWEDLISQYKGGSSSSNANRRDQLHRESILKAWKNEGGNLNTRWLNPFRAPVADLNSELILDRYGQDRIKNMLSDVVKQASDYGLDNSSYVRQLQDLAKASSLKESVGWAGTQRGDLGAYRYDINKFNEALGNVFNQINSEKENAFQRMVENKFGDQYRKALGEGQTFDDFLSGGFIDRTGAANEEQVRRMEALQKLTGAQTNALGTETGSGFGQDTALFQALKDRLGGAV